MKINLIIHGYEDFDEDRGFFPRQEAVMATYQHEGETDDQFSIRSENIRIRLSTITERERMKELGIEIPSWAVSIDKQLYSGYLYIEGAEIIEE